MDGSRPSACAAETPPLSKERLLGLCEGERTVDAAPRGSVPHQGSGQRRRRFMGWGGVGAGILPCLPAGDNPIESPALCEKEEEVPPVLGQSFFFFFLVVEDSPL